MKPTSAEDLNEHLKQNMPESSGFRTASVYLLGNIIAGEGAGAIIAHFVYDCWQDGVAPILIMERAKMTYSAAESFSLSLRRFKKIQDRHLGIYVVNPEDVSTRNVLSEVLGKNMPDCGLWFIYTSKH